MKNLKLNSELKVHQVVEILTRCPQLASLNVWVEDSGKMEVKHGHLRSFVMKASSKIDVEIGLCPLLLEAVLYKGVRSLEITGSPELRKLSIA